MGRNVKTFPGNNAEADPKKYTTPSQDKHAKIFPSNNAKMFLNKVVETFLNRSAIMFPDNNVKMLPARYAINNLDIMAAKLTGVIASAILLTMPSILGLTYYF